MFLGDRDRQASAAADALQAGLWREWLLQERSDLVDGLTNADFTWSARHMWRLKCGGPRHKYAAALW